MPTPEPPRVKPEVVFPEQCEYTSKAKPIKVAVPEMPKDKENYIMTIPSHRKNIIVRLNATADMDLKLVSNLNKEILVSFKEGKNWAPVEGGFTYDNMNIISCTDGCDMSQEVTIHGETQKIEASMEFEDEYIFINGVSTVPLDLYAVVWAEKAAADVWVIYDCDPSTCPDGCKEHA